MFELGFGDLEALVVDMHDLPINGGTVGSRFRYFQRLRFPDGANTGRGVPALYRLDQVLQVLVAFELVEAGVAPTRTVRTVRTGWSRLRGSMRLGWLAALGRVEWRHRELLTLEPHGLADAARAEDAAAPVEDPLTPLPAFALSGWSEGERDRADGPPRLVLVDPGRLMALLRGRMGAVTAFDAVDLDEEMERYAT